MVDEDPREECKAGRSLQILRVWKVLCLAAITTLTIFSALFWFDKLLYQRICYIDLSSGRARIQHRVFNTTITDRIRETEFSLAAQRAFAFRAEPDWLIESASTVTTRSRHEAAHGAFDACARMLEALKLAKMTTQEENEYLRLALDALRQNRIDAIESLVNEIWDTRVDIAEREVQN